MANATDLLTAVFETLHLRSIGGRALNFSAGSGIRFPARHEPRPPKALGIAPYPCNRPPDGVFHVLTEGQTVLRIDGMPGTTRLATGDFVLVLHGRGHELQDQPSALPRLVWDVLGTDVPGMTSPKQAGAWSIFGGTFHAADPTAARILDALPALIHIPKHQCHPPMWMDKLLPVITQEGKNPAPGSHAVAQHVMSLLFMLAVRNHILTMPDARRDRLGAFLDPEIGPALALIHARLDHPWTIAALAEECAMSRSAFAAKFAERLGMPPGQYLTRQRMERARCLLADPHHFLKEIAQSIGYASKSAFGNAFRRLEGISPGDYRRHSSVSPSHRPLSPD